MLLAPRTSVGKRQLKIFTELVVSFPFLSLERGQKQRSLLSPSTTGREKGRDWLVCVSGAAADSQVQ